MSIAPLPSVANDLSHHRILVTNDDGIHAPGLPLLEAVARRLTDDVWVVAPETEQSGTGHSLTLSQPLRLREIDERHFAVQGTPTDCVVIGVTKVLEDKRPTLVLSGVNSGGNLGEDITYSGTVAAAMEGTLLGIPSIALSQSIQPGNQGMDWRGADEAAESVVRWLVETGWPADALMNVNFPDRRQGPIKGMDITFQGKRDLSDIVLDQRTDMRGQPYYWIGFRRTKDLMHDDTDIKATREGCVSVTPLHLDLTHFETRDRMLEALFGAGDNG